MACMSSLNRIFLGARRWIPGHVTLEGSRNDEKSCKSDHGKHQKLQRQLLKLKAKKEAAAQWKRSLTFKF